MLQVESEMQKVAVAADISVLFFSAGASFLWQNMQLCYLNRSELNVGNCLRCSLKEPPVY